MDRALEARIVAYADGLPAVERKVSHARPSWFVGGRNFAILHPEGHHQHDFPHLWCAAAPGVQGELCAAFPDRFFVPPYVGHRGWVALRLDVEPDVDGVLGQLRDAWLAVAPPKVRKAHPDGP